MVLMINYKNKNIVKNDINIAHAIKKLNKLFIKCLIVIDKKNQKLIGSVTDGDIRRSILKGKKLSSSINSTIKKNSLFYYEEKFSKKKAIKIIKNSVNRVEIIPIVSKEKKILRLVTSKTLNIKKIINNKKISKNTKIVIMAGGKGTRLKPFTNILPKPLIPVKGKTVIEHIISSFVKQNIKEFIFTLNYKTKLLKSYFEELKPKYKINYIEEKKPLGTAGSLKLVNTKSTDYLLVTNCDTIINIDYSKLINFHIKNNNSLTIVACKKNYKFPYGTCKLNKYGEFIKISEKPKNKVLVNIGMYLINKNMLKFIKSNQKFDMTQLIKIIKKNNRVDIYPIEQNSWKDIGEWHEYKKTINFFNKKI